MLHLWRYHTNPEQLLHFSRSSTELYPIEYNEKTLMVAANSLDHGTYEECEEFCSNLKVDNHSNLKVDNHSNFRLPTEDELKYIYANRHKLFAMQNSHNKFMEFHDAFYWAMGTYGDSAFVMNLYNGYEDDNYEPDEFAMALPVCLVN